MVLLGIVERRVKVGQFRPLQGACESCVSRLRLVGHECYTSRSHGFLLHDGDLI